MDIDSVRNTTARLLYIHQLKQRGVKVAVNEMYTIGQRHHAVSSLTNSEVSDQTVLMN
jgi:hypothetical protein